MYAEAHLKAKLIAEPIAKSDNVICLALPPSMFVY
jgi:hypothetical protein